MESLRNLFFKQIFYLVPLCWPRCCARNTGLCHLFEQGLFHNFHSRTDLYCSLEGNRRGLPQEGMSRYILKSLIRPLQM